MSDEMTKAIFINGNRSGYHPNQCATNTLGEIIEYLEELAEAYGWDTEVYISNDHGYTYGGIRPYYGDVYVGEYNDHTVHHELEEEW